MTALLDLSGVSVAIGSAALLDGISLKVDRGQIVGLVGESGSGKSLTAMAAMGLLPLISGRVTGGTVRFDGQDMAAMTEVQRRKPDLIIADEPTTALDVTVQAQIIQILGGLVRDRGVALLLITHDMGVVAQVCARVAVLYAGRLAEEGPVDGIFAAPAHPYTAALIGCIPQEGMAKGSLRGIPGAVPSALAMPAGCRFHPRCPRASDLCRSTVPRSEPHGQGTVACHHAGVPA